MRITRSLFVLVELATIKCDGDTVVKNRAFSLAVGCGFSIVR